MGIRAAAAPVLVGLAGLAVLSGASAAALTLSAAPAAPAPPAAEPGVVAAYALPPAPVQLTFPAPAPPAPAAPAPAQPAAPAPAPAPEPAAAAAPPPAVPAPVDPLCAGDGWEQRRGQAALASLRRPSDAGSRVSFLPAHPELLGLAHLDSGRVDVYVRSCARQSDALLRHVVAHELGHALDVTRLTDEQRAQWRAERGIPAGTPWFGCDRCTDFATPAGDFAETYAQWQRGASSSRSELAPAPSRAELERLAALFFAPL